MNCQINLPNFLYRKPNPSKRTRFPYAVGCMQRGGGGIERRWGGTARLTLCRSRDGVRME